MYGEIVTRLRYKPAELLNTFLTINGTEASLSINPPEIPFPVLSEYEYCTIFLESFENNKDTLYEVRYEIHYKWNDLLYKIGEVTSVDGKAEFPRLIKGMSYYVTAIPLDGKYQSKQVRITLDEYDIRQEPVAVTTYENSDYKNYEHYLILKNIFGDATVYLEGNPDYISLDRNDKNLRVYLNKDATERASEFDLVIEDYRIEDIIIARKKILVNDGFSTPYDISIEFTDSNAAIFKWSTDGIYEINKFYISDNTINKGNPIDVIGTSTYIINNYDTSKTQYIWISSLRDGKEKFSDPITIDSFDRSINPLIGPSVNYSIKQNNDLVVYLNHNSTTVDNYSVYLEENEITSINGLTPIATSASKNIVIPNFDVYNNYDRTLKLVATTNKYNHSYLSDNKDLYVAYDWTPAKMSVPLSIFLDSNNLVFSENKIINWNDSSGNNNHFSTVVASQPTLSNLNGVNIAVFDGNVQYLTNSTSKSLYRNANSGWIFIVAKRISGANILSHESGISNNLRLGTGSTLGSARLDSDNILNPIGSGAIDNKWSMKYGLVDWQSGSMHLYLDGNSDPISNTFTPGKTSDTDSISGTTIGIFKPDTSTSNKANCEVACVIMGANNIPTINDINNLFGWAAHKYGLTDNLPDDHPYKNRRPLIDHTPYNLTAEFKND